MEWYAKGNHVPQCVFISTTEGREKQETLSHKRQTAGFYIVATQVTKGLKSKVSSPRSF